jgi:hypothetical protein
MSLGRWTVVRQEDPTVQLLPSAGPYPVPDRINGKMQLGLGERQHAVLTEQQEIEIRRLVEADVRHVR